MGHRLLFLLTTSKWTCCGSNWWELIQSYLQYKPSGYRKCYKGADIDKKDDNQIANPGQPSLGGILIKRKTKKCQSVFIQLYNVICGFKGHFIKSEKMAQETSLELSRLSAFYKLGVWSWKHMVLPDRKDLGKHATEFHYCKCKIQCIWSLTLSRDEISGYLNLCNCEPPVLF